MFGKARAVEKSAALYFFHHAFAQKAVQNITKEKIKMVYLVYLLALIFIVLGFLFGVSVGWKCVHGRNAVGNLMIAPGDENEQPYIFLDLTTSIEYLESSEYVVLKVKPLETREKQSV